MTSLSFVKMHGIANDYVYIDDFTSPTLDPFPPDRLSAIARAISDRHTGVGGDGLILVCRPTPAAAAAGAHVRMRMFNADGSESEMCGNGLRCVAKFAHDRLTLTPQELLVETGRGILAIRYLTQAGCLISATVDMGEPILDTASIPARADSLDPAPAQGRAVSLRGLGDPAVLVSMGNPHAVFFQWNGRQLSAQQLAALDLPRIGPSIEHHRAFPNRVNAHFVSITSKREATMRTWERGAGATLACGTGACAVAVAGSLLGLLDRECLLHLPGGDLAIRWDDRTSHVFMTGPAEDAFVGTWNSPLLEPSPRP